MTTQIILCRHTQTGDNARGVLSSQYDVPLNQTGVEQALRLAERIAELPGPKIQAVLSSDLQRAVFLAELIAGHVGLDPVFSPELREVHLGQMTRMNKADAERLYPSEQYRTLNPAFDFTDIGGETAAQVLNRQLRLIGQELARFGHKDVRIVVVGHGSALRLLFRDHLGLIEDLHPQGEFQEVTW